MRSRSFQKMQLVVLCAASTDRRCRCQSRASRLVKRRGDKMDRVAVITVIVSRNFGNKHESRPPLFFAASPRLCTHGVASNLLIILEFADDGMLFLADDGWSLTV